MDSLEAFVRDDTRTSIPSLVELSQIRIINILEEQEYHPRVINEIAKHLQLLEHLLEPILQALVEKRVITDVAFLAFLVPTRAALDITGISGIRNSTLKLIGYSCSQLVYLNMSDCQLGNSVVRTILAGCVRLETLTLDNCPRISDAAFDPHHNPFENLRAVLTLKSISLKGCPQICGSCSKPFRKMYLGLEYLNLSQCKSLKRKYVADLLTIRRLRHLDISFVESVQDECFVAGFKEPLDSFCGPYISHSLESLSLGQCAISDVALGYFSNFKCLLHLALQWNLGITDAGIEAISKLCPLMSTLDLTSCPITDQSLQHLTENSLQLTELNISWCGAVSDKGVIYMISGASEGKLGEFRFLRATWCTAITEASLYELVQLKSFAFFEALGHSLTEDCKTHLEKSGINVIL